MRKKLLYLTVMVSLTVAASCGTGVERDTAAERKIGRIADKVQADSSAVSFSLDTLAEYAWDEVIIISPYSQLGKLGRSTNVDLSPLEETGIEINDSKNVIAFIADGKVVRYVDLPRHKGDFSHLEDSLGYSVFTRSSGEAKFRMVNERGRAVVEMDKESVSNRPSVH